MRIALYKNDSPQNAATKEVTNKGTITGVLKDKTSVTDPVVIIQTANLPDFNYFRIPDFGRSYFLMNVVSVAKNLWEIHGHCDVLSSFWADIAKCQCIIARSESNRNTLLIDTELWVTARSRYGFAKSTQQPLIGNNATKRFVIILPGSGTGTSQPTTP